MGRYPLKTAIGEFVKARKEYYAETSAITTESTLNTIERVYSDLRAKNPELKAEPANWGEPEVMAILLAMRQNGISRNTQLTRVSVLKQLLRFVGNGVMDRMRARCPQVFPRQETERKPGLGEDQLSKVLTASDSIRGWRGECIRFMTWAYAYTGLRLNELRMAEYSDLDVKNWTIRVSHPKGERTYGVQRILPIPEPLRPIVSRFLSARDRRLAKKGLLETGPLVFAHNPKRPVTKTTVQRWKVELENLSGIPFTMHGLRRTYGQNLLNRGVTLETVSLALGHSSTLTTEKHYCRKDADSARLEIVRAFEKSTMPSVNPPVIDRKERLAGYA
jgi:integrase